MGQLQPVAVDPSNRVATGPRHDAVYSPHRGILPLFYVGLLGGGGTTLESLKKSKDPGDQNAASFLAKQLSKNEIGYGGNVLLARTSSVLLLGTWRWIRGK